MDHLCSDKFPEDQRDEDDWGKLCEQSGKQRDDRLGTLNHISKDTIFLNTCMVIFIFLKINLWMRLNDNFSNLYTLVIMCIKDILLFMFFFLYWIMFFSALFMVTGADFNVNETADDYKSISSYQIFFL